MTAEHVSSALTGIGSSIANHIWQSTAFAATVGLLTTLLRKHQARIRFSLWLAASIKFLLPFSLLIALGGLLPKPQHVATNSQTGIYAAIDIAGQPFSVGNVPPIQSAAHAESLLRHLTTQLPLVFAAIWLFGAFVVLLVWFRRWRQVSAILHRATPVQQGREIRLLRRLEETTGRQGQIALRLSSELMEPGVFGIVRPVLIWPERLSERLDEEQMEAILSHEMTHLRRHDNLAAAIHMLVEILFWFHPMVWWMERRMVEERERDCDEAVLRLGSSPEAYAEGLLKACRFCVEAPLACVSGITGADLSRRVRAIMALHLGRQLGIKEKLLLTLAVAMTIAGPVTFGVMSAAQTSSTQSTAVPERQAAQDITGNWQGTVKAQTDAGEIPAPPPPPKLMPADADPSFEVATIKPNDSGATRIADRFQLKSHKETRDMSTFGLTADKGGAKIAHTQFNGPLPNLGLQPATGGLTFMMTNGAMQDFTGYLQTLVLDRPAVDHTRLQGKFDFTLTFLPDETQFNGHSPVGKFADGVKPAPTLFEAVH